MESIEPDNVTALTSQEDRDSEVEQVHVTAADLQRAHTRVTARLGDVACEDRDTVSVSSDLEG